jgi:hypothetical protein
MITIESAESALRNIYLDVVVNNINTKTNPFLTMIGKNTKDIAGREIKCNIRYGDNGNVVAGPEDGDLPVSTNSKYAEISVPLKNLYGTFQITDKAIRASQNNAGAFANLLSGEMQNLVSTAQASLNEMLYGNGQAFAAYTTRHNFGSAVRSFRIPVRFVENLKVGDKINFYTPNNVKVAIVGGDVIIESIDTVTGNCTYEAGAMPVATRQERLYIVKHENEGAGLVLNGIDSLFMQDGRIYNLDTARHKGINPFLTAVEVVGNEYAPVVTEDDVLTFLDGYEEHCQGNPADIILTHPMMRKAIFENLKEFRSNIDVTEMAGGFKGFSFNGIPMYADVKCKGGTLYALNSDSFGMHQLCDWTWLSGDDGSILKQIDGKAAYNATLVKYADLICEKPFLQGKLTGYSTKRWKASQDAAEFFANRD